MAAEPLPPPTDEEEEGGGPVKPFLEHLEDLRWTIIKVLAAVVLSMLVCLVAGNQLVRLLTYPLVKAQLLTPRADDTAKLRIGDQVVGTIPLAGLSSNLWKGVPPETLSMSVTLVGTNLVLALTADPVDSVPGVQGDVVLKNYSPIGGIVVALKLALFGGMALASPFVMLFIGQFVVPALRVTEKKVLYRSLAIGIGLFMVGVAFCYFVIMQITILATVQFSEWLGFRADEWRAEDYIDFVLKMMLAVGLSFQLPVVLLTLVRVGVLSYETLVKYRSYFIVANMVACALITPSGDPFTMLMLAIPVQFLFEISVWIARIWWRREQRELAAREAAEAAQD